MMRTWVKKHLLQSTFGRMAYGRAQEAWFDWTYRERRERYERRALEAEHACDPSSVVRDARARLQGRGYRARARNIGDVHTYAFIPGNWPHQEHIARALGHLGPVTRFDYTKQGLSLDSLRDRSSGAAKQRTMLASMLDHLRKIHAARPVDWFFSYALGWDMDRQTVEAIQDELGIPTVNISLDDKNWWDYLERGDERSSLKRVLPHFDLAWTSARVVVPWYRAEGGRAVFLPEGVDCEWFRPLDVEQDIDIGFVGSRFGWRERQLELLRKAGLTVRHYGFGWTTGALDDEAMLRFFSRCKINLGFGDMHFSRWLTNLKGRDFEIPATGRGLYLTTYNADLASCFDVGSEIRCYRGLDEAVELLRFYLRHEDERTEHAKRARARCVSEHAWHHRMASLLVALGVVNQLPAHAEASWRLMGLREAPGLTS